MQLSKIQKDILIAIVGLAVVAGIFILWKSKTEIKTVEDAINSRQIESFTLSGEVKKIDKNGMTIRVGKVEETEVGNQYVAKDREFKFTESTKFEAIFKDDFGDGDYTLVHEGEVATLFFEGNPFFEEDIMPVKVAVNRK